ncbi:MAG: hypothetical protein GYB68_10430 [Chloroflexi bacterium]|nr:hypothetical protein [Chloroflexota bacterium]
MPVTIEWMDENQGIACWAYNGDWTWTDLRQANEAWARDMRGMNDAIYALHDFTNAGEPPDKLLQNLPHMLSLPGLNSPSQMNVLINAKGILRRAATIFSRLYAPLHMVSSLDEALDLINNQEAEFIN